MIGWSERETSIYRIQGYEILQTATACARPSHQIKPRFAEVTPQLRRPFETLRAASALDGGLLLAIINHILDAGGVRTCRNAHRSRMQLASSATKRRCGAVCPVLIFHLTCCDRSNVTVRLVCSPAQTANLVTMRVYRINESGSGIL